MRPDEVVGVAQKLERARETRRVAHLATRASVHVREYQIVVPRDCIAAPTPAQTRFALKYFEGVLDAGGRLSSRVIL